MEENKYLLFKFEGITGIKKNVSLKECLEKVFTGFSYIDYNTKTFFTMKTFNFARYEKSIEDIYNIIENKGVIFPISKSQDTFEVKMYVNAGFNVLFVSASDFRKIKKELSK